MTTAGCRGRVPAGPPRGRRARAAVIAVLAAAVTVFVGMAAMRGAPADATPRHPAAPIRPVAPAQAADCDANPVEAFRCAVANHPAFQDPKHCDENTTYAGLIPDGCHGEYPVSRYDIYYSAGISPTSWGNNLVGMLTGLAYNIGTWFIGLAQWSIEWAFEFPIDEYTSIGQDLSDQYQTTVFDDDRMRLRELAIVVLVAYAGYNVLRNRATMALGELLVSVVLMACCGYLIAEDHLTGYMTGTWNTMNHGTAALLVAAQPPADTNGDGVVDEKDSDTNSDGVVDEKDGPTTDPAYADVDDIEHAVAGVQTELHDVFVVQPWDHINWGLDLGQLGDPDSPNYRPDLNLKPCFDVRQRILDGDMRTWAGEKLDWGERWLDGAQAFLNNTWSHVPNVLGLSDGLTIATNAIFGAVDVVTGGIGMIPGVAPTQPWSAMSEEAACGGISAFNATPTFSRLGSAVLSMFASGVSGLVLTAMALTVVVSKLTALLLFAVAPFVGILAAFPGAGRRLGWVWLTTLVQTIAVVIGMALVLSTALTVLQMVLSATGEPTAISGAGELAGQRPLIERFAIVVAIVMIMAAVRQRMLAGAQSAAGRYTDNLTNVRLAGGGMSWQGPTGSTGADLGHAGRLFQTGTRRAMWGAAVGTGLALAAGQRWSAQRFRERRMWHNTVKARLLGDQANYVTARSYIGGDNSGSMAAVAPRGGHPPTGFPGTPGTSGSGHVVGVTGGRGGAGVAPGTGGPGLPAGGGGGGAVPAGPADNYWVKASDAHTRYGAQSPQYEYYRTMGTLHANHPIAERDALAAAGPMPKKAKEARKKRDEVVGSVRAQYHRHEQMARQKYEQRMGMDPGGVAAAPTPWDRPGLGNPNPGGGDRPVAMLSAAREFSEVVHTVPVYPREFTTRPKTKMTRNPLNWATFPVRATYRRAQWKIRYGWMQPHLRRGVRLAEEARQLQLRGARERGWHL